MHRLALVRYHVVLWHSDSSLVRRTSFVAQTEILLFSFFEENSTEILVSLNSNMLNWGDEMTKKKGRGDGYFCH